MRRKLFTFLVAFLATLSGAVWGETYQLESMSGNTNISGGNHIITGTATQDVRFTITGNTTITLQNAHFKSSKGAINNCPINLSGNGTTLTLILEGVNTIESTKGGWPSERACAIHVVQGTKLIIDKSSTGQLTAIGRVAIGSNLIADCGEIEILGGTVIAKGTDDGWWTPASVGGNNIVGNTSGTVTVNGDGVLIAAQAVNIGKDNKHFDGGIVFDASTIGEVKGDQVELKSPLDLDNLTLKVPNGKTLTLGKGIKIDNANNLQIESGGTVNGFKFVYDSSVEGYTSDALEKLPGVFYCGPETPYTISEWEQGDVYITDKGNYTHFKGYWVDQNNDWQKCEAKTTLSSLSGSLEQNTTTFKAVWVMKDRNLYYEAENGLDGQVYLWYPTDANLFKASTLDTEAMTNAGLQIDPKNEYQLVKVDPFQILTEGKYDIKFSITPQNISASTLTPTVHVDVNQKPLDLEDDKDRITVEIQPGVTYDGQNIGKQETVLIYIDKALYPDHQPVEENQYEVFYQKEGESGWVTSIKDAGTYKLKIKGSGDDTSGALTNKEIELEEQFTVSPAELTVKAKNNAIPWNILNEGDKPTLTNNVVIDESGIMENDAVTVSATISSVAGAEGTEGNNWENTPGTYTVTLTGFSIDNSNYIISSSTQNVTYTLNVYKYFDGDNYEPKYPTDLKPGDGSGLTWKEDAFEKVYDGNAIDIQTLILDGGKKITKVDNLEEGTEGFTISYEPSDIKNKGNYKAVINISCKGYYAKNVEMPLRITKRPLKVSVKPLNADLSKTDITESDVEFEKAVENRGLVEGETLGVSGTVEIKEGEPGKYTATFSDLNITDKDPYKADNYSAEFLYGEQTIGETPIDINPGDVDGDVVLPEGSGWDFKDNTYYRTYDGETHNIEKVLVNGDEKTPSSVSYQYTNDQQSVSSVNDVLNAGNYVATINIDGKIATLILRIDKRKLKADILDQAIENVNGFVFEINENTVKFSGNVEDEIVSYGGFLKLGISDLNPGHKYINAIEFSDDFGIADEDVNNFKASNYECEQFKGDLIVKQSIDPTDPVDPTDPEDPDNPIIIPGGDNNDDWTWDADKKAFVITYDGDEHPITKLQVKITEDDKVNYEKVTVKAVYVPSTPKDVVDGGYTATVEIEENDYIKAGTITLKLMIIPADLSVDFNIPNPLTEEEASAWNADDITFEGLVNNKQEPSIPSDCHLEISGDRVILKGFSIKDNLDNGFKVQNYSITYLNNGDDIVIAGEGDIEIPDIEIDDNDGGIIVDYNDLHIIKSTGAKLTSRYNKMRTKDGGSFTLSLEKEEGYEDCEPTVYIKRGRYDEWKVLKLDEVSGFYQIRNVYTDIYVKVSGDGIWPVSNEEVEAQEVKVYTQNGAIVVVTPSVMDVQVVSMTGSVVAADKVAGQREFRNLVEGVYIVRVGDKIVKVRL